MTKKYRKLEQSLSTINLELRKILAQINNVKTKTEAESYLAKNEIMLDTGIFEAVVNSSLEKPKWYAARQWWNWYQKRKVRAMARAAKDKLDELEKAWKDLVNLAYK